MLRPPGRLLRLRPLPGLELRLQRLQPLLQGGLLLGSAPGRVLRPAGRDLPSGSPLLGIFASGIFASDGLTPDGFTPDISMLRPASPLAPRLQAFLQGRGRPRPAPRILRHRGLPGLLRALSLAGAARPLGVFHRKSGAARGGQRHVHVQG